MKRKGILIALFCFAQISFADSPGTLRLELQKLYPYFNLATINSKIVAAKDPLKFLDSFIPLFYVRFKTASFPASIVSLTKESGWCVGDAHIENFGTLMNSRDRAIFTVNDMDDAGPCPIVADALKFFTVLLLDDPTRKLDEVIKAYRAGLKGVAFEFSPTVKDLIDAADSDGSKPKKKDIQGLRLVRDPADDNLKEVASINIPEVQAALLRAYGPKTQLLDLYQTRKIGGGSHGLLRFRTLVRFSNGTLQIIEFKQMVTPGVFPAATATIPSGVERLRITLKAEQGDYASPFYQWQTLNIRDPELSKVEMLLRPRFSGNHPVHIGDFSSRELKDIILDEAQLLGAIHARTATHSSNYIAGAKLVTSADWSLAAQIMKDKLEVAFQALH